MAQSLEYFIHDDNKGKIANVIAKASRMKMDADQTSTYSHKTCLEIRDRFFTPAMKKNTVLLQSCLYLGNILPRTGKKEYISDDILSTIDCGRYTIENNEKIHNEEYLHLNIKAYQQQRKIIFIMFGYMDYFVYPYEDGHGHVAHSVCAILIPRKDHYACYYINSHGQDMKKTDFYQWIVSKYRVKRISYTKPVDIVFMENMVRYWNSLSTESDMHIRYTGDSEYTYLGPDLQAGDIHGVCFMFPQIIWYYFGRYYHKIHTIQNDSIKYRIPTGKKLMKHGNLDLFIISCFADFCPQYEKNMTQQWTHLHRHQYLINYTSLQDMIEKRQTRFLKPILRALTNFIAQDYFKQKN